MMIRFDPALKLLFAAALILLAPAPSWANEKLAGDWKLDASRSEGGRMNFSGIDLSLTVDGDKFMVKQLVHRDSGDETFEYAYVTDGEPHTVAGPGENSREVTARWRKGRLEATYLAPNAENVTVKETWKIKRGVLELRYVAPNPIGGTFLIKRTYVRE
jgi:hypothetical protein